MKEHSKDINYKPIKKNKVSDQIVEEIWRLITTGVLNPGDKLPPERELKDKFDVSLATLRDALRTLEAYGHITKKRGAEGGSFILDVAPTKGIDFLFNFLKINNLSLQELHEARLNLDPLLAAYAAENIDEEGRSLLINLIEDHQRDYDLRGTSRFGWEFYIILAKLSNNQIFILLQELFIRLLLDFEFTNSISDLESTDEQYSYNEETIVAHKRIVEAILNHDADKAKNEMILHRMAWFRHLKELIKD
jgi:GntR family transcriptional repressor for pyruvate dehydrogenase complex